MWRLWRVLSPMGFVLAAASFALPFVAARYSNAEMGRIAFTWHGLDLTIGGAGRVHVSTMQWDAELRRYVLIDVSDFFAAQIREYPIVIPGQPAFIIAVLAVLAGALAPILAGPRSRLLLAASGGMAGTCALVMGEVLVMRRLDSRFAGQDLLPVPAYGFWIAVGLLVALSVANVVGVIRLSEPTAGAAPVPVPAVPPGVA